MTRLGRNQLGSSSKCQGNFLLFLSETRYEVNFQNGIECGGAYVKLLSKTSELNLVGTLSAYVKFVLRARW